jgi:hypothetical protein
MFVHLKLIIIVLSIDIFVVQAITVFTFVLLSVIFLVCFCKIIRD